MAPAPEAVNRSYRRITCKPRELDPKENPFGDLVSNISRSGCFIETDQEFGIGDRYELLIHYPPGEKPKAIPGEVVWQATSSRGEEGGEPVRGYGIRFLDEDPATVATIVDATIYFKVMQKI